MTITNEVTKEAIDPKNWKKIKKMVSVLVEERPPQKSLALLLPLTLPNGESEHDYERCKTWSRKRWAWEFLIRNEQFRDACEKVRLIADETEQKRTAARVSAEFGLRKFKHWASRFDDEKPRLVSIVTFLPSIEEFVERVKGKSTEVCRKRLSLSPTQVIIKFDIRPTQVARTTALNAQIKAAKKRLEKFADAFQEIEPGAQKKKQTTTTDQLLIYLRAYDLYLNSKDDADICLTIRGESRDRGTAEAKRKAGEELRSAAEKWVQTDYLLLPILKIKKS